MRFGYGSVVPWVRRSDDGSLQAVAGPDRLVLRAPLSLRPRGRTHVGEFTVTAGCWNAASQLLARPRPAENTPKFRFEAMQARYARHELAAHEKRNAIMAVKAAMKPEIEVLIVGAGPTGLVLALWLSHLGVKVRIVDKAAEPGTTSRALAVHARIL
jgi:FAD binding domain